ncbi:MAG TPA: hypothetical protein VGS97_22265, partial [Actinocrinis sp.]|nr:hypothetical protein [Actinocrinis sp.]
MRADLYRSALVDGRFGVERPTVGRSTVGLGQLAAGFLQVGFQELLESLGPLVAVVDVAVRLVV